MTADPTETLRALMPFAAPLGGDGAGRQRRRRLRVPEPAARRGRHHQTDIRDAQQRLAARVTQTQLVLAEAGK